MIFWYTRHAIPHKSCKYVTYYARENSTNSQPIHKVDIHIINIILNQSYSSRIPFKDFNT